MSFICDLCHKVQGNGMKPHRIVVSHREKIYPVRREIPGDPKSKIIDNGGRGMEIEQEANFCNVCYGYKG